MARVMSFAMMVFIIVPILAPSMGQGILALSSWRAIFFVLLGAATAVAVWAALRVPETRPLSEERPLSARSIVLALRMIFASRQTAGYMIAQGFMFGIPTSYITCAQQIFVDVYGLGAAFPLAFGAIASFMIAASIVNAAVVRHIGMRAVSHRALIGLLALCGAFVLAGFAPKPPLILFCAFIGGVFFCFGLIAPNFNALTMEKVAEIAGTASSLSGFYATAAGVLFGSLIGQAFDGSVRPLIIGITVLAVATFVLVLFIERFRLGQPSLAPLRSAE
jgi:DHA1 family bicyclomycin/chloramphenicol resistance-like MFS transporter